MRGEDVVVEPERRTADAAGAVPETESAGVSRSVFLEGATLGLGVAIGGLITIPVAGFAVLPGFLGQELHKVDLGPIERFPLNQWYVATFIVDPTEGEVSKRAAFLRNNGTVADPKTNQQVPSFSIISNRCTHLGCPTQANGPSGLRFTGKPTIREHTLTGPAEFIPVVPAGYGCPCHGSQFDTEGNRTAGPAPRALDRYAFEINHGRLVLLGTYSVSEVVGTGAQAQIHKYKQAGPGEHIDGPEQVLYPLQPPHN
jgi:Rieske Fe-S protein